MRCMTALLTCPAFFALASTAAAFQATTMRVSVDSAGAQGDGHSGNVSISADGRFVAFSSNAANLVVGDTNGEYDTFVHDRIGGVTERVSVATGGAQANSTSYERSNLISGDGRLVVFLSAASNLVAGDTNAGLDVFVRDRQNATTERVSVATGGAEANDASDHGPSISTDGRVVLFGSWASNLVAGDTNGYEDVFVRDRITGTTERVSVDAAGAQANSVCRVGSISGDGGCVAFESNASNLVAGDTNNASDIFVRDRTAGTTERVSVDSSSMQSNGFSRDASISADGRFIAFWSIASNLVAGDANAAADVFVHDRATATTERVSLSSTGAQQNNGLPDPPSICANGRFVTFSSVATNLVVGDTNGLPDVFVRDRQSGTTELASLATDGAPGNEQSVRPTISADGRFVVFNSVASNLVTGDTNNSVDSFVRDRGPQSPVVYCTSSTSSQGCSASIAASANPSVAFANACNITVASVEGQKSGLLFYGVDNTGFTPLPWAPASTSWLCVKPPTQRTAIQNSGGTFNLCDGAFVLDWNAYQSANPLALGNPWSAGAKVYAQAWFRDPLAVKSTNLSSAVEMIYSP